MSVNEILLGTVLVVLLFSGVMFRFALYYRDQVKAFQEEARKIKHEFLRDSMKMTEERNRAIREQSVVIKRRDQTIEKLKKQIKQYEEVMKQNQDAIKSEDEVKK
ncbi:hypothetical protein MF1_03790 [Bartonella quintana]|uniref:Phage related protein n=2 Tax=Bartonella quintana TaxID=803 RepID=A0A0H3LUP1_BARQU|nr:hypothetical protein [Bartonella quintana]AFR26575.1 phage related protein [Bartonella quintana RM-11]ETS14038.1 hypothetical protein Q650_00658 [Bartonella quintana JK 73rel]ETS15725.1 hypothetical protein Q649_00667 [Bartonella quintana JK 73]KEC59263.1 hypothetical protein O93_00594 [Bartonella quintana JK 19]KEC68931.1 hypothetical protein O7Q_00713 [Bartonella quintana JK 39]